MHVIFGHSLSVEEADGLRIAAQAALNAHGSPATPSFHEGLEEHVRRIPESVRTVMNEFRESRSLCALRISGVRVVPDRRGPTPLSWQEALDGGRQDPEEAQLALLASCLGKVFAWPTIQRGRMAQNLIPVERHRSVQPRFDGTDRWLKRISVAGSPPSDLGAGTGTRARAL